MNTNQTDAGVHGSAGSSDSTSLPASPITSKAQDLPGSSHTRSNSGSNSSANLNSILDGGGATTVPTTTMLDGSSTNAKGTPSESKRLTLRTTDDDLDDEAVAMAAQSGSQGMYPPMTDEDLESKKVEEHLRHLEMVERQRRKAAREARNARTPSSVVGDVTRRASLLIFSRSNSVRARGRPSSDMGHRGSWAMMRSRDSEDTSTDSAGSPATTAVSEHSPKIDSHANVPHRSNSTTSTATVKSSATARSGPNNPFSSRYQADGAPLDDPFDPPKDDYMDSSLQLQQLPPSHRPNTPTHKRATSEGEKDRTPTKTDIKGKGKERHDGTPDPIQRPRSVVNLPPAAMLVDELPQPRMPPTMTDPTSGQGHWRRTTNQSQHEQAQLEEEERDKTRGRWWTDWFCGCREAGPDTYLRNEQAARTNPFE